MGLQMRITLLQHCKVLMTPLRHNDLAPAIEEERSVVADPGANLEYSLASEIEVERAEVLLSSLIVLDIIPIVKVLDGLTRPVRLRRVGNSTTKHRLSGRYGLQPVSLKFGLGGPLRLRAYAVGSSRRTRRTFRLQLSDLKVHLRVRASQRSVLRKAQPTATQAHHSGRFYE